MDKFKQLGISEPILRVIEEFGFENPTEVQEKSIPYVIEGKDIIAGAATGSGKTLVFGSGIIQFTQKQGVIQSLVLVPTRELAEQVTQELRKFSKHSPLNIVDVYGGVSITRQITELKRADIVVGTPGRILDHLNRGTIELGYVKMLVLDEADRMLDMGFIRDVKKIIEKCPRNRQTMLFSATLSNDILKLSSSYMDHPIKISCTSDVDPLKLTQIYYDVQDDLKFSTLVHFLKNDKSGLVMVFCNTKRSVDFIARNLQELNLKALAIHGGHTQERRKKTMEQFHSQSIDVLVCTDVAARGLDIKGISHIYNYDTPKEPSQYIHRIGRTARAGKEGKAIIILASKDYDNFSKLKHEYPDLPVKKEILPEIEKIFTKFKSDRFRGNRSFGKNRFSGNRENRSSGSGQRSGGQSSRFGGNRETRFRGQGQRSGGQSSRFGINRNFSRGKTENLFTRNKKPFHSNRRDYDAEDSDERPSRFGNNKKSYSRSRNSRRRGNKSFNGKNFSRSRY